MIFKINSEMYRILSLSACFFLLLASETTFLNMQKTITSSIHDDVPGFHLEGYTVMGLHYVVFAVSVWFGPCITYTLGAKMTMTLAAIGYLCHLVAYIFESELIIYIGAIVIGFSAGNLWPAQGHYMFNISTRKSTPRNVSIFYFIVPTNQIFCNTIVYFLFYGKKYIDRPTRRIVIYVLSAINVFSILAFLLLPKLETNHKKNNPNVLKTLKGSIGIFTSTKMLWLMLTFIYMGMQQSFGHGIYSPSVGFTLAFGDSAKQLVALSGMFMGIGFITGSFCAMVFSGWLSRNRKYRKIMVLVGVSAQLITYLIAYINLPNSAIFGNTEDVGYIGPSATLAMLGSVLIMFGDACLTTQVYSMIGDYYRDESAQACSIFKFIKAMSVASSFFFSKYFGLHTVVTVMASMAVLGMLGIFMADAETKEEKEKNCGGKTNLGSVEMEKPCEGKDNLGYIKNDGSKA